MNAAGQIHFYTYKDGLLARLAHDLRLSLGRYRISLDAGRVTATFDLQSLIVDGAIERGRLNASTLSDSDKRKVIATMQDEVLHCHAHPEATFEGDARRERTGRFSVTGRLTLHGRSEPLTVTVNLTEQLGGDFEFAPSRWGIPPFRAMAGALKVQDRIRMVFALPADGSALSPTDWQGAKLSWSSP